MLVATIWWPNPGSQVLAAMSWLPCPAGYTLILILRKEFADNETQVIVARSSISWASPLHMMEKADDIWRPCSDYRLLNLETKPLPSSTLGGFVSPLSQHDSLLKTGLEDGVIPGASGHPRCAEDWCHYTI